MIVALYNLLEVLSILLCISYLYGKKFKFDIATVSVIAIDLILMQAIVQLELPQNTSFIGTTIIIGYCIVEYKFNLKELVVNTILYIIILGSLQYASGVVYILFSGNNRVSIFAALGINGLLLFIVLFLLKKCKLYSISKYLQDKGRLLVISIISCFIIVIICLVLYKQDKFFDAISTGVILVSVSLCCILSVNLGKYRIKVTETETELKVHKLYENSFESLINSIRRKQHEFDNHIHTIYSQHHIYKNYDELVSVQEKYCHELEHENYYNKLLSNGNSVMIGFLYGKFLEIEKQKIELLYKVNIGNLQCNIPIYKLIEILSNLLNNAMEALKISIDKRSLFVALIELDEEIRMEVRNKSQKYSYEELQRFFEKGYSKKGENRGLGLYNVKKICVEYGCRMVCENILIEDGNWLSFKIEIFK